MNNSKSSLFLMELIISILFFSISAVVCVQLFVSSHLTNAHTTELTNTNIIVQNLSEAFLGCDGDIDMVQTILEASSLDSELSTLSIAYDSTWNTCPLDSEDASYIANMYCHEEGNMVLAQITVLDHNGNTLANQTIKHYNQIEMEVMQ